MTILVLAGGVGGAKFAHGLTRVMDPSDVAICVNTADDFELMGLPICPDLDTVTYTLAGLADQTRGWGLAGETWGFVDQVGRLGGEDWFLLGDRDMAIHVLRRSHFDAGGSLSQFTAEMNDTLGTKARVIPMTEDRVRTIVDTEEGPLAFQEYFVREKCMPKVKAIRFDGIETARPNAEIMDLLRSPRLDGVIIAPSNPYLSIDPILVLPNLRPAIAGLTCPVVAISPIVGGAAIKGPASKIMGELGIEPSAKAVADHYQGLAESLILDRRDAEEAETVRGVLGGALVTDTIMSDTAKREALARDVMTHLWALAKDQGEEGHGPDNTADYSVSRPE